jgi:glycosyltransferase involved in cell wall biosynthesis
VKVVHIITDLAIGGAETALCRLLEHSTRNGSGVKHGVVSLMKGGALGHRIRAAGIKVEELDLAPGSIPVSRVFRLSEAIRRQQPDIIQGWMYHGNMAATVAKYLQRPARPVMWGIRYCPGTLEDDKPTTRLVIRLGWPLSRLPAAIVYCARESARQHERLGYRAEKSVVIPNGFDTDAFKPDATAKARLAGEIGVSCDTPIVGLVARFHPNKDIGNIIRAAALLSNAGHDFHLVLVGSGLDDANRKLTGAIQSFGLGRRTTLLGRRQDAARVMAGCDMYCSCSASEAFPNVVAEAMACGVPCAVTDVGDSALIVGNTGIVVPARDPEALADGLSRLLALGPERRRQLGRAARRRIIEHYSLPGIVRQYEALYRGVARRSAEM